MIHCASGLLQQPILCKQHPETNDLWTFYEDQVGCPQCLKLLEDRKKPTKLIVELEISNSLGKSLQQDVGLELVQGMLTREFRRVYGDCRPIGIRVDAQ